ncbi:MAG TPA: 2'-5' RNA ligase family protein [Candidatus Ozemobacteraceae bacterium]|nr:2'-5' RNA ligase family protein [Candidatus Ozemobacteraceae bacterium]
MNDAKPKLPYTVAFMIPPEAINLLVFWRKKVAPFCEKIDPLEVAHMTVKYLGFPSETFREESVVSLIPRLAKIVAPHLPVRVSVRGLDLFDCHCEPVVYLKVVSGGALAEIHDAIRVGLGKDIETFPHADGENYRPHITISKQIKHRQIDALRQLIHRSKKSAKRTFKLTQLVLLTPWDIYPILPLVGRKHPPTNW